MLKNQKPETSGEKISRWIVNKLSSFIVKSIDGFLTKEEAVNKRTLKEIFPEDTIETKEDPDKNEKINLKEKSDGYEAGEDQGILYEGFKKSYYKYNSFDSNQEFILAKEMDKLNDIDFWIRNKRQYGHEYGIDHEYYPDFIVKTEENKIYVIEVKEEREIKDLSYKSKQKYKILRKIDNNNIKSLLISHKDVEDKIRMKVGQMSGYYLL